MAREEAARNRSGSARGARGAAGARGGTRSGIPGRARGIFFAVMKLQGVVELLCASTFPAMFRSIPMLICFIP